MNPKPRRALHLRHRFVLWLERVGFLADDPTPAYSSLDRLDGWSAEMDRKLAAMTADPDGYLARLRDHHRGR